MSRRELRFGVTSRGMDREAWLRSLRRAEDLGYWSILLTDHVTNQALAPLTALAAAASITSRLRLGTLVLDIDFRNPAVLAKELASIDVLSNGRLEVGLGAGWLPVDYVKLGVRLDPPGVRIARFAESLQIVRPFLAGAGPITFRGQHFQVEGLDTVPRAVQAHVPIIIGGGQPRMLTLAAREADIVNISNRANRLRFNGADPADPGSTSFASQVAHIRQAAGPRYAGLQLQTTVWHVRVTDTPHVAVDELAQCLQLSPEVVKDSPSVLVGSVESIVEQIEERRERFDISYFVIDDVAIEAFAPVVARLTSSS